MSFEELLGHQEALKNLGASAHAVMHQPRGGVGSELMPGLEMDANQPPSTRLMDHILASITENKPVPSTWEGRGRLPTGQDGLMQTRIVCAIIESAATRREVSLD